MQDQEIVRHRVPFWIGPFRAGGWSLDLVTQVLMPDPDKTCPVRRPRLEQLPATASGLLRRSEPVCDQPQIEPQPTLIRYELCRYDRRFARLSGSMDDYLAGFSSKTRSTLRRKVRRFAEVSGGKIDVRAYSSPDGMVEFFRLARSISEHTYQERFYKAGLPSDRAYLDRMVELAAADSVRAWILFLDEKPIIYLSCPARADRLNYEKLGFLPDHARLSPGTVLQMMAFDDLLKEHKFRLLDFSEGSGEHKRLFGNVSIPCANVLYLRPGIGARRFVAMHRATTALSRALESATERIGVKTRLRQVLRRQRT